MHYCKSKYPSKEGSNFIQFLGQSSFERYCYQFDIRIKETVHKENQKVRLRREFVTCIGSSLFIAGDRGLLDTVAFINNRIYQSLDPSPI